MLDTLKVLRIEGGRKLYSHPVIWAKVCSRETKSFVLRTMLTTKMRIKSLTHQLKTLPYVLIMPPNKTLRLYK